MAAPEMLGYIIFALLHALCLSQNAAPPVVDGSYKAMGELAEILPNSGNIVVQVAFEETYDVATKNAAFTIWELGKKIAFVENSLSNQTLRYVDNAECGVITAADWIKVEAPPSLMGYENPNGTLRFSLKQLLKLDSKNLVKKGAGANATFRGVPANVWVYEINGTADGKKTKVNIYAYWSDSTWNTTSSDNVVPLGYRITKLIYGAKETDNILSEQTVSVYAFIHDAVDRKAFEPVEGVYCPNRTHPYKFPTLPKIQAISFRSEFILPDDQEIKTIDTWYDMRHEMLRVDLDRIMGQEPVYLKAGRKYSSEMTSMQIDTTFQIDMFKGAISCNVFPTSTSYQFDYQDLINPKLKKWNIDSFFGLNNTNYVYIGKTYKRNIPCHLFQGWRTDWPEQKAPLKSLWEWCFAMNMSSTDEQVQFRDGALGLVNVHIKVIESTSTDYPVGYRMIHHFYDVMQEDPATLDASVFDVSRCFTDNQKKALQFTVDIDIDENNLDQIENATSDVQFLRLWKEAICEKSDLQMYTLRVARVKSSVYQNKLFISFMMLDVHEKLPDKIKESQESLETSYELLRDAIDNGEVAIQYQPSKKDKIIPMKAAKDSLTYLVDKTKDLVQTTEGPEPTGPVQVKSTRELASTELTPSTIPIFDPSMTPPPVKPVTSSKKPTKEPSTKFNSDATIGPSGTPEPESIKMIGHKPGTVAGVSIFMLLMGITVGAGGTFYKYKGLPSCGR